mmetsp:Transcript_43328/g.129937  ORF Transcript_43328/g.129937 Transcript_43328/m.129937 type:complete len:338 (-) Transcript_43328:78-1091(-)
MGDAIAGRLCISDEILRTRAASNGVRPSRIARTSCWMHATRVCSILMAECRPTRCAVSCSEPLALPDGRILATWSTPMRSASDVSTAYSERANTCVGRPSITCISVSNSVTGRSLRVASTPVDSSSSSGLSLSSSLSAIMPALKVASALVIASPVVYQPTVSSFGKTCLYCSFLRFKNSWSMTGAPSGPASTLISKVFEMSSVRPECAPSSAPKTLAEGCPVFAAMRVWWSLTLIKTSGCSFSSRPLVLMRVPAESSTMDVDIEGGGDAAIKGTRDGMWIGRVVRGRPGRPRASSAHAAPAAGSCCCSRCRCRCVSVRASLSHALGRREVTEREEAG